MPKSKDIFADALDELPRLYLSHFLEAKFQTLGVTATPQLLKELTDRLMGGEEFEDFSHPDLPEDFALEITPEDQARFDEGAARFLEELPNLLSDQIRAGATSLRRLLIRRWPEQLLSEKQAHVAFQSRLELRWGAGLNGLRMLLTIAREIGQEHSDRLRRSRAKKNRQRTGVLIQLHIRACQIVSEIILLLENGYADGAMARWRTLHEVSVVALLIAEHGDKLAERYLAHEAVEARNILKVHADTFETLGYRPHSKREIDSVEAAYQAALRQYGDKFGDEYGWADGYVRQTRSFAALSEAAGRSHFRAHYKLASHNVHAGVKGITYKLGSLHGGGAFAGASNAGLEEPGQNTAITFTLVTFLLFDAKPKGDDVIILKLLTDLQDETVKGFVQAGRRLKRDVRQPAAGPPKPRR